MYGRGSNFTHSQCEHFTNLPALINSSFSGGTGITRPSFLIEAAAAVNPRAIDFNFGIVGFILPNVKAQRRSGLARSVLLGAQSVTSHSVRCSAWFGVWWFSPKNHSPTQTFFFSLVYIYDRKIFLGGPNAFVFDFFPLRGTFAIRLPVP